MRWPKAVDSELWVRFPPFLHMTTKEHLEQNGFEPEKSVGSMSTEQLYDLIKLSCRNAVLGE